MQVRGFRLLLVLALLWTGVAPAAENFTLIDAQGKSHSLAGYRGKWVIVNFWATWCPPCLEEIPDLVAIKESRKDLEVIGIAMEFQDARQVMQFAEGMFVNYPIVLGDRKISESIGQVDGLPTTFIYDPQGRLAQRHVGKITRKQIEKLIGGKKAGLAEGSVVASQRTERVAAFDIQVVAQDRAAVAQIGAQVEQILVAIADQFQPERHHLHVAARARLRHRVFAEFALHLNDAEHQLRIEPGSGRFVLHGNKKILAGDIVRNMPFQPPRHVGKPRGAFRLRCEGQPLTGAIGHGTVQYRLHARGKRLVLLLARER